MCQGEITPQGIGFRARLSGGRLPDPIGNGGAGGGPRPHRRGVRFACGLQSTLSAEIRAITAADKRKQWRRNISRRKISISCWWGTSARFRDALKKEFPVRRYRRNSFRSGGPVSAGAPRVPAGQKRRLRPATPESLDKGNELSPRGGAGIAEQRQANLLAAANRRWRRDDPSRLGFKNGILHNPGRPGMCTSTGELHIRTVHSAKSSSAAAPRCSNLRRAICLAAIPRRDHDTTRYINEFERRLHAIRRRLGNLSASARRKNHAGKPSAKSKSPEENSCGGRI